MGKGWVSSPGKTRCGERHIRTLGQKLTVGRTFDANQLHRSMYPQEKVVISDSIHMTITQRNMKVSTMVMTARANVDVLGDFWGS